MSNSGFSLRPVFVGPLVLLAQLPLQLFMSFWSGGFIGGMLSSFGILPPGRPTFVSIGLIAFFAIPLFIYFTKKLSYARTEYRFYPDRLEFEEGFFTINKKVVKFRDVKEVTLRKGVLQRAYGLGTIYLATLATGTTAGNSFSGFGFGNISGSGIKVLDINEPDTAYEDIRRIVDLAQENPA